MIDVWNWLLWWKNEIQVVSQVFLKTPTLYAVTAEITEKRLGEQSYLATSREDVREAHTILAYCFTDSLFSFLNRPVMSQCKVVYRRFFRFWLNFPNRNYKQCSKECHFNWLWHHTLHLKKKTFPIFEKLLKTSGTTTSFLSCLKITLTSMRVDRLQVLWTSSPGSRPLKLFSLPPPPPPPGLVSKSLGRNSSTASAEELYFSFYSE